MSETRLCTNSVMVLKVHCSYKAPSTHHIYAFCLIYQGLGVIKYLGKVDQTSIRHDPVW